MLLLAAGIASGAAAPPDVQCALTSKKAEDRAAACTLALGDQTRPAPERAVLLLDRAFAELDLKNDPAVLADTGTALDLDPGQWPAHWLRAEAFERGHDYTAAAAAWGQLIDRFPAQSGVLWHRGLALDNAGKSDEAIPLFNKAIATETAPVQLAHLFLDRGIAEAVIGQREAALADYAAAIAHDAGLGAAYLARGRLHYLSGEWAPALADLTKAGSYESGNAPYIGLWLYLAHARAHQDGKPDLERLAAGWNRTAWPGPVVALFLGERSEAEVTLPFHYKDWETARDQCERAFYEGELALVHGDRKKAVGLFQESVATGITAYVEYRAAAAELRILAP
jgi:lipoprotein NlpI